MNHNNKKRENIKNTHINIKIKESERKKEAKATLMKSNNMKLG
jgi:hypothetical protein